MAINLGSIASKVATYTSPTGLVYKAITGNDLDPTPGFNIAHAGSQNGAPTIAATGTRTPLGTGSSSSATANKPSGNAPDTTQPTGDPYPQIGSSGSGTGSSTNGAGYTVAEVAALNAQYDTKIDALRKQLGLVDTTERQGLDQLNNTYTNNLNQGVAKYGTQRDDNAQARLGKLEGIDNSARTGYDGLRRLLGLSGSANQSALQVAKSAVARDASGKRSDAIDLYGRNERDIDTAEQQFKKGLADERDQRQQSFLQGLLEQRNSLQAELGSAQQNRLATNGANYEAIRAAYTPAQQAIDANNAKLSALTDQYATKLDTTANNPELADYTVDKTAISANNQNGGTGEDYSPYSSFLLRKKVQTV